MTIPTTPEFCTISDVKEYSGIGADNSSMDERITRTIRLVTKNIQKYCRREFIKRERTEFFPTVDRRYTSEPQTIMPKEMKFDMSATFNLWYDEYIVDWTSGLPLTINEDYAVDTDRSQITLFINTIKRTRSVKLLYTAGWPVSTSLETPNLIEVDSDLRTVCAMQAHYSLERAMNKQIGQKKIVSKDKEIDLTVGAQEAFLPEILPTLNSYRSYSFLVM